MFEQLLTISRNTFTESIRQPVFVVLIFVASLVLLLNPQLAAYTMDNDNKMMIDMGLSTLFLTGLLLAAFTATGVLSEEVEKKTVLTVVSKPVARPLFVVGKYLGVAAALAVAMWILAVVFLLTVRHGVMQTAGDQFDMPVILLGLAAWVLALALAAGGNYLYHWVFTSVFVKSLAALLTLTILLVLLIAPGWNLQSLAFEFSHEGHWPGGQLLIVMLLVFEAVMLLTSVAIAVSTRLGMIMTILICAGVFMLGLVSETMLGPSSRAATSDATGLGAGVGWLVGRVTYWALPNLQFLWLADALPRELHVPLSHVAWLTGYAVLQIAAVLCLAVALFQTREVG